MDPSCWGYISDPPCPSELSFLILCVNPGIEGILDDETITKIQSIEPMQVTHTGNSKHKKGYRDRGFNKNTVMRKPKVKQSVDTLDEALKQKITAELNKLTDKSFDKICTNIKDRCSRLSDDGKKWIVQSIVYMAKSQHRFADLFVRFIIEMSTADDIIKEYSVEYIERHSLQIVDAMFEKVDNGDTYSDFCDANKLKHLKRGHAIFIAECVNHKVIKKMEVLNDAINSVMASIPKIKVDIPNVTRESTESRIDIVCSFFTILAKTKRDKPGFKTLIDTVKTIIDNEKTSEKEIKLPPKAKFALMDLVDGRYKL